MPLASPTLCELLRVEGIWTVVKRKGLHIMKKLVQATAATAVLAALSIGATADTITFVNVLPVEDGYILLSGVSHHLNAGIYNLTVDGKPVDSFCIDPYDTITTGSHDGYNYVSLDLAPDPAANNMGLAKATSIEQLWAHAYDPNMTQNAAVAMQLAIWEIVAGDAFSVTWNSWATGVKTLYDGYFTFLGSADENTPTANLIALTHPDKQDFVIGVPDGGVTLALLGISMGGLAFFARRKES